MFYADQAPQAKIFFRVPQAKIFLIFGAAGENFFLGVLCGPFGFGPHTACIMGRGGGVLWDTSFMKGRGTAA